MIKRTPEIKLPGLVQLFLGSAACTNDERTSYTGYARFALLNLLKVLGMGRGDRILLPAYICDVVLLPLAELGIEPVYYRVTSDFQVDWDSVEVQPGSRAFISVSYFGVSQNYTAIADYCASHDLVWLNDNAHGFASSLGNTSLEEFGDFSFTSFRKVLGSVNGARVRINNDRFLPLKGELDRLNGAAPPEPRRRFVAAAGLRTLGIRLRALPDFSDPRGFGDDDMKAHQADLLALKQLAASDRDTIRLHRRRLYQAVELFLLGAGCKEMLPVPRLLREGNSPLVLPVVTRDHRAWLDLLNRARRHGLDLHTWPSLPEAVLDHNICGAADLWRRMLYLPLHQGVEPEIYLPLLQKVLDAV
ncbi:DegT/DnrJ/EryC1/StrS family aminotransferase [Geomonas anaerohicana]|uniref:DegT/DnrJ/EryC1/StrS family aminotransferase n=1 Tax=Geomonas anaerohicana TaxID=2798583 RepID=A0ABS0YIN0_9BACT|nr:DegT/DnrJ/EryC1/StrS family aminotransferase [Geomonas anaerohicana]MBJ6752188.1 DegT/DnrJ/EryC1/StrS family aminotransferase [Geomonas anaerohicana]